MRDQRIPRKPAMDCICGNGVGLLRGTRVGFAPNAAPHNSRPPAPRRTRAGRGRGTMLELLPDEYTDLDGYQRTKFIKATLAAWYARRVVTGRCPTFTELSNSTGMALGRYMDFYVLHLLAMD